MPPAEVLLGELAAEIELIQPVVLVGELFQFGLCGGDERLLLPDGLIRGLQVGRYGVRGHEKPGELVVVHGLQVGDRYLVLALGADVFAGISNVHLGPAFAEGDAGEEVDVLAGGLLAGDLPLVEDVVALLPQFLGDDGRNRGQDPLAFGLQLPRLRAVVRAGIVLAEDALRGRVAKEAVDGGV